MQKTGSQVLDSICISEAEKQAVLTLIREEVTPQHETRIRVVVARTALLTAGSRFRSSLKRQWPTTGRQSTRTADKKSAR